MYIRKLPKGNGLEAIASQSQIKHFIPERRSCFQLLNFSIKFSLVQCSLQIDSNATWLFRFQILDFNPPLWILFSLIFYESNTLGERWFRFRVRLGYVLLLLGLGCQACDMGRRPRRRIVTVVVLFGFVLRLVKTGLFWGFGTVYFWICLFLLVTTWRINRLSPPNLSRARLRLSRIQSLGGASCIACVFQITSFPSVSGVVRECVRLDWTFHAISSLPCTTFLLLSLILVPCWFGFLSLIFLWSRWLELFKFAFLRKLFSFHNQLSCSTSFRVLRGVSSLEDLCRWVEETRISTAGTDLVRYGDELNRSRGIARGWRRSLAANGRGRCALVMLRASLLG